MLKIFNILLFFLIISSCSIFKTGEKEKEISTVEETYKKAMVISKGNKYGEAIGLFREVIINAPFTPLALKSQIEIAYAQYKLREYDFAIKELDSFLNLNPLHKDVPYVHYLRGMSYFDKGKSFFNRVLPHVQADKDPTIIKKAFKDFKILVTKYKYTKYKNDAAKRIIYIRNTLASYELHVANYYYKRKAYVAVINRCNYLIQNYPKAPKIADALIFLRESYSKLKMTDNKRDIEKVIKENYPNYISPYFEEIKEEALKENFIAISKGADDITEFLGLEISEQPDDDFKDKFVMEYFDNSDSIQLIDQKRSEKYEIIRKIPEKNLELKDNDNNEDSWFFKKDLRDIKVKDFTLGQETENGKKLDEEITAEEPIVEEITAEEPIVEEITAEEPIVEEITSDNLNNP